MLRVRARARGWRAEYLGTYVGSIHLIWHRVYDPVIHPSFLCNRPPIALRS